ncbi:arylalkylamine N-acetyltransferase 1 [Anabrus simplex]|uniref:arylalkylamine N-acetyltransferase 1 n=1 Tax=Anabrus simplex TaxID=316456 RepID=UPI0035A2AD8C
MYNLVRYASETLDCIDFGAQTPGLYMFEDIEYALIPEKRYEDVIQHLRDNFFADEPLNYSVSLCRPGEPHAELEQHSLNTLRDGLSLMAVKISTREVMGVALNGVQRPGDAAAAKLKLETMTDKKFRKIFELLYDCNLKADLFSAYHVDRIFECRILSVDKRFRGRGLAKELLQRSESVARKKGFRVLKEDATGYFSQRVAESLGLEVVLEVRYSDYKSEDTGEVVFNTEPPHECLKIMVKVLS